jgi:hypothetical protein
MIMNGRSYPKTISGLFHNRTFSLVLEIFLLVGLGMTAILLHSRLRYPMHIPGRHGIEFMAIMMMVRYGSRLRFAATASSLGVLLMLLFPYIGFKDPLMGFNYLLPGVVLDIIYNLGRSWTRNSLFLIFIAGVSYMTVPLCKIVVFLSTGYPYSSFIKYGTVIPVLSFLGFGMAGGLIGLVIIKAVRRAK